MDKKRATATEAELKAIDAVKAAIKALPSTIFMTVDDGDGVVEFWKPHDIGAAHQAAQPLRHKRAFTNQRRFRM